MRVVSEVRGLSSFLFCVYVKLHVSVVHGVLRSQLKRTVKIFLLRRNKNLKQNATIIHSHKSTARHLSALPLGVSSTDIIEWSLRNEYIQKLPRTHTIGSTQVVLLSWIYRSPKEFKHCNFNSCTYKRDTSCFLLDDAASLFSRASQKVPDTRTKVSACRSTSPDGTQTKDCHSWAVPPTPSLLDTLPAASARYRGAS